MTQPMSKERAVEVIEAVAVCIERGTAHRGDATSLRKALSALRQGEAVAWMVGQSVFSSEAEAIEEIMQWGPSGAIAIPLYAHPPAQAATQPERPQGGVVDAAGFKNFHRSLCARFGYTHDENFWWRDLVSLEEHIAALATPQPAPAVVASKQIITPTCRANRGNGGALGAAVDRVVEAYRQYVDAPNNTGVEWHLTLTRVEPITPPQPVAGKEG